MLILPETSTNAIKDKCEHSNLKMSGACSVGGCYIIGEFYIFGVLWHPDCETRTHSLWSHINSTCLQMNESTGATLIQKAQSCFMLVLTDCFNSGLGSSLWGDTCSSVREVSRHSQLWQPNPCTMLETLPGDGMADKKPMFEVNVIFAVTRKSGSSKGGCLCKENNGVWPHVA